MHTFLIEQGESEPTVTVVVTEGDFDQACQTAHSVLRGLRPELWSEDWRDLKYDIEVGNQICYETPTVYVNHVKLLVPG